MNRSESEGRITKEEVMDIEGYEIKISYADKDNPCALSAIRTLLEKQKIMPQKSTKFDDNEEK